MDANGILQIVTEMLITYGPKLLAAIAIWFVGMWAIKIVLNLISSMLDKGNVDPTLKPFISGLTSTVLKVLIVLSALGMLGFQMTSFIAIVGAAGLAVGMALSGTLQNFAGGVIILIFKPFKIGDVIDSSGYIGKVSEIQIFNTVLKTPDNKTIMIPNGGLSTSSMTNFSTEATRRVYWTIGVAYGDDLAKAKQVIKNLCDADGRILKDPEVFIAVAELADSSVNFTVRAWVEAADYWDVYFAMNENIYNTFNQQGLNIPFPQMDVHLHKNVD